MDELRLILLVVGAIIILLIYLWGTRKQIKARLEEKRRRRMARNQSPSMNDAEAVNPAQAAVEDEMHSARSDSTADSDVATASLSSAESGLGSNNASPFVPEEAKAATVSAATEHADAEPEPAIAAPPIDTARLDDDIDIVHARSEATPAQSAPAAAASDRRRAQSGPLELNIMVTVLAPQGRYFTGPEIRNSCHDMELILNDRGIWDCYLDVETGDGPVFGVGHLKEPGTFDEATMSGLSTPGLLLFSALPGPSKAVSVVDMMLATAGELARKLGGTVCDERRNKMSPQTMIYMRTEAAEFDQRVQDER